MECRQFIYLFIYLFIYCHVLDAQYHVAAALACLYIFLALSMFIIARVGMLIKIKVM